MLKKQVSQYINTQLSEAEVSSGEIHLEVYNEEKHFIEKYQMLPNTNKEIKLIERQPLTRFQDAYIERCNKETDELLAVEHADFLHNSIHYFKENLDEFMYLESPWFNIIGVDAISFEADSVFHTYDVMFGLKLPKKVGSIIRTSFHQCLKENSVFDLMFNQNEGMWDVNFALNDLPNYSQDWTIQETYCEIYSFIFHLLELIEESHLK